MGIKTRLKERWTRLLPSADHPACRQETPYNLNRYILLLVYFLIVFFTSAVYFSWPSVTYLMISNGAFESYCPKDADGNFINDMRLIGKNYICEQQEATAQQMFPIVQACNFTVSAFAGVVLDSLGMKKCILLGLVISTLGWFFICLSKFSDVLYYIGFLLVGGGCDVIFFPVLPVANLFAGSRGLVYTILGAAASLSFYVPVILKSIWVRLSSSGYKVSLYQLVLGYLGAAVLPSVICCCFLFPNKNFKSEDEYDEEGTVNPNVGTCGNTNVDGKELQTIFTCGSGNKGELAIDEETLDTTGKNKSTMSDIMPCDRNSQLECVSTHEQNNIKVDEPKPSLGAKLLGLLHDFSIHFRSPSYIMICVYFCSVACAVSYYNQGASNRLFVSQSVVEFFEIIVPLSCIPCVFLGKVSDLYNPLVMIFFINCCGVLTYLFVIIKNVVTNYFSAIFFMLYVSVYTSQIVCYISEVFPPEHFGKLIGFTTMIAGLISLITIPLYSSLTVKTLVGDAQYVCIGFLALLGSTFLLIYFLWICFRKKSAKRASISV